MGRKKKGKKQQDNAPTSHSFLNTHVTEELEALEAIFGDLYAVLADGMGCKVTCIPFPGGSDENDRVVSLEARFPEHYPHKPVHIQLSDVQSLRQSDVDELQKLLEGKAIEHAESGMVAVHNLALDCSEWLRTATRADENEQTSLYEAYQQRETAEGKVRHEDMRNRFATLTADWVNRPAEPVLQEGQGQGRRTVAATPRPTATTKEAHTKATDRSLVAVDAGAFENAGTSAVQGTDRQADIHTKGEDAKGDAGAHHSRVNNSGPRSGPLASVLSRSMGLVTSALRGLRSRRATGEPTLSRMGSSSGRVVLQELLHMGSREACQQALTIAALHQNFSQAGVATAAQHELVEQMVKSGVVTSAAGALLLEPDGMRDFLVWVEALDATACPPALRELLLRTPAAGSSSVAQGGHRMGRATKPNKSSRSLSTVAFQSRPQLAPARDARPRRYEMEFIEQERLGQGGFGVVVAAVNRIDGRRYAVKKIPMPGADMGATTLREVSTLSGLHHGHIVRYYQAWREHVDHKLDDSASVDESDLFAGHTTPAQSDSAPTVASAHHMRTTTMWSIESDSQTDLVRPNVNSGVLDTVREASQDLGSTPSQHAPVPRITLDGASTSGAGGGGGVGSGSNSKATPRSPKHAVLGADDSDAVSGVREELSDSLFYTKDQDHDLVQFPDEGTSSPLATARFYDATDAETASATSADAAPRESLPSTSEGFSGSFDHKSEGGNSAFTFAHSHSEQDGTASVVTTRAPGQVSQEVLYIQMEFCPTTLKRQLRKGSFKDEHAWRVLRQLLSALAYLHQRGIIHRDVKPDNVFYDSRNDIKLGDFGLAKFTTQETAAQAGQDHPRHGKDRSHDPTATDAYSKDVGTELYIAPEVRAGKQYGSKVDIFAVGIIIVELWSEFSTEMERIQTLLRVRDGALPEYMLQHHPMAARLAEALLQNDPARRPGAAEVLKSHMLPATATDEQVTDLLRAMPEHPDVFYRLVGALFTESSSPATDESSGGTKGPAGADKKPVPHLSVSSDITAAGVPLSSTSATQLAIMHCVERVCSAHSCLQMQSRVLGASTSVTAPEAVKLLSSSGQQLALRSQDLRTPFCVWLAAQAQAASASSTASFTGPGMECMRRYEMSQVYLQNVETPKWLAAIDIVRAGTDHAAGRDAPMLAEAELIRMSYDICSSVEALKGCNVDIQLSHASLLVAVLDHLGVGEAVQDSFVQALQALMASRLPGEKASAAGLKGKPWAVFCQSLQQLNLSIGRVKPLLMSLPTDSRDAVTWLRSVLPQAADSTSPAAQALADLDKLIEMLDIWEVGTSTKGVSVSVDPFMLIPSREFQSVFFRVSVWQDKASGTTIDLTAMTEFASKLGVARTPTERSLSSAEVLVASRGGGGMLKERMAVVSQLWRSGNLPAETMQVLEPSAKQQYVYAHARGVKALVILEPQNFELKKMVKVKLLDRKAADTFQTLDDLVPHLLSVLGPVQRT